MECSIANVEGCGLMDNVLKQDLIAEVRNIINANENNVHCDAFQLADMIEQAIRLNASETEFDPSELDNEGC